MKAISVTAPFSASKRKNLVKDAETPDRDRWKPSVRVVVGIATVIEMKSTNHFVMEQPGDKFVRCSAPDSDALYPQVHTPCGPAALAKSKAIPQSAISV